MQIRIQTYGDFQFEPIEREYGEVLKKYNLQNISGNAYITLNSLDELFKLHHEIDYSNEIFGILTNKDSNGEFILVIKDNYD